MSQVRRTVTRSAGLASVPPGLAYSHLRVEEADPIGRVGGTSPTARRTRGRADGRRPSGVNLTSGLAPRCGLLNQLAREGRGENTRETPTRLRPNALACRGRERAEHRRAQ